MAHSDNLLTVSIAPTRIRNRYYILLCALDTGIAQVDPIRLRFGTVMALAMLVTMRTSCAEAPNDVYHAKRNGTGRI
jgi:hypothetical protein